jgi:hypothetical protein
MGKSSIIRSITYQEAKVKSTLFLLQNGVKLVFLFLSSLIMASCEKVVQLNLNNSTSVIVIQANINDQSGPYEVKISRSVDFDQSSDYPPVTGADVVISDNGGQSESLSEYISGTYFTSKLRGIPGHTYSLTVKTGGKTFHASAFMPPPVNLDSIYFSMNPFSGEKVTTIQFRDPPLNINFYRLVYFINNIQQKRFYTLDDELYQGKAIGYSLMSRDSDTKLKSGDKVEVWLESVDKGVYEYFRTAGHDDGNSASPSNPVSNISNGALGYFNACSVRKITATVRK